jgi:hypothetical protein
MVRGSRYLTFYAGSLPTDCSPEGAAHEVTWSPGLLLILVASSSLNICYISGSLTVTGESGYRKCLKQS